MPSKNLPNVTLEGVRIMFRNFAGRAEKFNKEGDRNFCVVLPQDLADKMAADGWNVRQTTPREEGDEPVLYVNVAVRYDIRPPRITTITSAGRTLLDEKTVATLDGADILDVDLVIRPSYWEQPDGSAGIKAYLKTMFVKIDEDELERKYATSDQSSVADND